MRSHRRKSLAAGLFITVGTTILVFMHAMTMGISDTMVLNTTALHTGHVFTEFRSSKTDPMAVADNVMKSKSVAVALPRYRFAGIIRHSGAAGPALVFGVRTDAEQKATAIGGRIAVGRYPAAGTHEALIGKELAGSLRLNIGEGVSLWQAGGTDLGTFTVTGIFETGIERFDKGGVYVPIETLPSPAMNRSDAEVAVFLHDPQKLESAVRELNDSLSSKSAIAFRPWTDLMPDLVQLIHLNTVSTTILMVLVFALVGFGIANIFVLTIVDRFRELGILKAMGMTPGEIVFLVFLESFMVCAMATLTGLLAGWGFSELSAAFGIDLGALTSHNRYFVVSGMVYPRVTLSGLVWPAVISLAVSVVASWLPARVVARKLTAKALRSS